MNYNLALRMTAEELRSLDFATIGAAYMGIGTSFENPIRILWIQNLTDALLMFSLDGVTDHFPLTSTGFVLLDVASNKSQQETCYFPAGQRIYVRYEGGAPSAGAAYVSVFYTTGAS